MPIFVGARHQRGHSLGSMLSGLFRRIILPFFKANGRMMATKAIMTGLRVADDVAQGESFKESAKRRIPEGIKATARKIKWQTGSKGKRRRRILIPRYNDIFA